MKDGGSMKMAPRQQELGSSSVCFSSLCGFLFVFSGRRFVVCLQRHFLRAPPASCPSSHLDFVCLPIAATTDAFVPSVRMRRRVCAVSEETSPTGLCSCQWRSSPLTPLHKPLI